jgi:hypothetical protein
MTWLLAWLTCPIHPQRWRFPSCASCVAVRERVLPFVERKRKLRTLREKLRGREKA